MTPPWKHFTFACIAPSDSQATIVFQKDGRQVEGDPRFDVFRRNSETIEVSAPFGLQEVDSMAIEYVHYLIAKYFTPLTKLELSSLSMIFSKCSRYSSPNSVMIQVIARRGLPKGDDLALA